MVGRIAVIIGGVLAGVFATTVVYEILERENPELIQKFKGWFGAADDLEKTEEATAD